MGDKPLPGIAVEDIGRCAYGIFKRGPRIHRQHRRHRRRAPDRHADGGGALARRSGSTGHVQRGVAGDLPRRSAFLAPTISATCSSYKRDFNDEYRGARDIAFSRSLNPKLQDFGTWLSGHAKQIPL